MKGMFATSKAGHDKGKLYIIMEEEDEYVYLSDGRLRTVDKLKKKNILQNTKLYAIIILFVLHSYLIHFIRESRIFHFVMLIL